MTGRKWYEWLLALVYLAMIAVFVYLNFFSENAPGTANLIVNAVMFVMVGIIFLNCEFHAFRPADRMIGDIRRVCLQIRQDADTAAERGEPLWARYRQNGDLLFAEGMLRERYTDFVRETERILHAGKPQFRCDLEDFIDESAADDVLHRNLVNQVPGALTGLGILGTFIGLSIGLQSFATGSTAEITGSIAPLMSGIKVAFHTSIYGMVFSLVFNYVFKRKIEETEAAIRVFLMTHRNFVLPDAETDGRNLLLEIQREQVTAVQKLSETIASSLADGLEELLEPQFDRFDETLRDFAKGAEKNQLDALSTITNAFIAEMNRSLGNSFSQLSYTIDSTFKLQQQNAAQLEAVLKGTAQSAERYTAWLADQERLVTSLHDSVEKLPEETGRTVRELSSSLDSTGAQFKEMVQELTRMTEQVPYSYSAAYDGVRSAVTEVQHAIDRLNDSLLETVRRIDEAGKAQPKDKDRPPLFGRR
ncbi:MAG: MotA/TolQ/ExbB proton channel family protein [Lachnospiraceae bacterium]|nr:MotA/TolQ/ExbB proton channel family protein [Lachnospiraceae bacterium]